MLHPIVTETPVVHYGLTWVGQYDDVRVADSWQAQRGDYRYTILDLGYLALVLITNTRTSREIGHRCVSMKQAALVASEHAQATYF